MSVASDRIRRDPELRAPVRTAHSVGGVPHGNLQFTPGPPSQLSRRPSSAASNVEEARVNLEFVRKEAELKELELELENKRARLRIKRDILTAEKELKIQEVLENSDNFEDHDIQLEEEKRNRTETFVRQSMPNSTRNQETLKDTLQFSNFLLKKELLSTRFVKFSDKPENYLHWKKQFISLVEELELSHSEQLDLLVKYLGDKSSPQAVSIRNSCQNAERALTQVWKRLNDRFGRSEMILDSLNRRLCSIERITGNQGYSKLYDLLDWVNEVDYLMTSPEFVTLLGHFNTPMGLNPVIQKLPFAIQSKWINKAANYKETNCVAYPPFSVFAGFLESMAGRYNDPALVISDKQSQRFDAKSVSSSTRTHHHLITRKTDVETPRVQPPVPSVHECAIHGKGHPLNACRAFRQKPFEERKQILREKKICFRCCDSNSHMARDCKAFVTCRVCNKGHPTALHVHSDTTTMRSHGGEQESKIVSKCTAVCGEKVGGRSCSKTVLVKVFKPEEPDRYIYTYAVHDDQSNRSLASTELLYELRIADARQRYTLSSCAGKTSILSRSVSNLMVCAIDDSCQLEVKNLVECEIPSDISEIPTPEVAASFSHLRPIKDKFPELLENPHIGLLIGRDVPEAHHVQEQVLGDQKRLPFAQKLPLGWVLVGEVCLGQLHVNETCENIKTFKTEVLKSDRTTLLCPCQNALKVSEKINTSDDIFKVTKADDQVGLSQDDKKFLQIMDNSIDMKDGHWTAPLPLRNPREKLPDNKLSVYKRASSLRASLQKNPVKQEQMHKFMQQILDSGAAEEAPPLKEGTECWYLPFLGVYHPRKLNKVRGVFDSSAVFDGNSLNNILLTGPNCTNSLLGVLLRFRRNAVAVMCDVQQMFYCFKVNKEYRDLLRFFWHKDNDPKKELIEYRMTVHVFGNSPSPAVATYCLRKAVETADEDVRTFVNRDFYVDDALTSHFKEEEAIDLIKRTQETLSRSSIRLHKIASNSRVVISSFPEEDLAIDTTSFDISTDEMPDQASLGLKWNTNADTFEFKINIAERPFTRRGVVATVNSIFDPLGFLAPVTIEGKILVREIMNEAATSDWDEPLPSHLEGKWEQWKSSLSSLNDITIPRMYTMTNFTAEDALHIYSDASEKAISAVCFVRTATETGFVLGKSRLAPANTTIPRLELCAAVLATEIAEIISEHLDYPMERFIFHSDSRVVLGYLNNQSRRFYTYVANRVQIILKRTSVHQWNYVHTSNNPADLATRCSTPAKSLDASMWIKGPKTLPNESRSPDLFTLVNEDQDCEIRPIVKVSKTDINRDITETFEKFSSWKSLISAFSLVRRWVQSFRSKRKLSQDTVESRKETEKFVLNAIQKSYYPSEVKSLTDKKRVGVKSPIASLNPFLDEKGMLRVGGRIHKAPFDADFKHPILVPRKSHVAGLLVNHFHGLVHHQGRLYTEAAIRNHGYWIVGVKRLVSSIIYQCVTCRRLRGNFVNQQMANLPADRLTPGPPFTYVGVDTFGPWPVVTRRTRGGVAESKRWAIIFVCLVTRASHIEVIEDMSSSAFINALRRFISIRGPVKEFRSERNQFCWCFEGH